MTEPLIFAVGDTALSLRAAAQGCSGDAYSATAQSSTPFSVQHNLFGYPQELPTSHGRLRLFLTSVNLPHIRLDFRFIAAELVVPFVWEFVDIGVWTARESLLEAGHIGIGRCAWSVASSSVSSGFIDIFDLDKGFGLAAMHQKSTGIITVNIVRSLVVTGAAVKATGGFGGGTIMGLHKLKKPPVPGQVPIVFPPHYHAEAWYPESGVPRASYDAAPDVLKSYSVAWVNYYWGVTLAHELGHAMTLDHPEVAPYRFAGMPVDGNLMTSGAGKLSDSVHLTKMQRAQALPYTLPPCAK